jgi:hypothetical protein
MDMPGLIHLPVSYVNSQTHASRPSVVGKKTISPSNVQLASNSKNKIFFYDYLGGGPVVKIWDQDVCSLCSFRFESCSCLYDGHWRLTWSLTLGPVGLVKVHAS